MENKLKVFDKDYGFKAYLILKFNGVIKREDNETYIELSTEQTENELKIKYLNSDFSIYNNLLRNIIKKG